MGKEGDATGISNGTPPAKFFDERAENILEKLLNVLQMRLHESTSRNGNDNNKKQGEEDLVKDGGSEN